MKHTFLVHGFNVRDEGRGTVNRLRCFLTSSSKVSNFKYGWIGLLGALFKNSRIALHLKQLSFTEPGRKYAIGHSNGAAIIAAAINKGARFETVLLINPALKVNTKFGKSVKHIVVIYTNHDIPTRMARFFDNVPVLSLLVPNAWGAMGAVGYKGEDNRVLNMNLTDVLDSHSDLFDTDNLTSLGSTLTQLLYNPTSFK